MALRDEALREYASQLQQAGFAVYVPTRPNARHFAYSRIVDGAECVGFVQERQFGGYEHTMPIHPSQACGSSMFVDGVPDDLTVQVARKIASPGNGNSIIGWHPNYRHSIGRATYDAWEVLPTPAFVAGDRVQRYVVGIRPWYGTITHDRDGRYADIAWDHTPIPDTCVDMAHATIRVVE